jgi:fucose permease
VPPFLLLVPFFILCHTFHTHFIMSTRPPLLSPSSLSTSQAHRSEWILLHLDFVLIGVITTLLGPILPFFSRLWSLTDAQAGFFFATQYFGSFLGVALTSVLLPRYGFSRVISIGFVAFALGSVFLGVGPWFLATFFVAVYGFGYGLANPSINLRATQLPSSNVAAAVSLLNFSWGLGAVLCPFLVGFLVPNLGIRGLAVLFTVLSSALCFTHFSRPSGLAPDRAPQPRRPPAVWLARLRQAPWIPLLLLFFLYVGVEISMGGWVALDEKRMGAASTSALSMAPSFFYGFLLLGRAIVPLALKQFTQAAIAIGSLLCAAIGIAVVGLAHTHTVLFLGSALAGLGCAPQYPIYVTWLAALFRDDAPWLGALFFGAAGLGASVLPWFVGIVAAQTHSLRIGFLIPLIACLSLVFLAYRARPHHSHS